MNSFIDLLLSHADNNTLRFPIFFLHEIPTFIGIRHPGCLTQKNVANIEHSSSHVLYHALKTVRYGKIVPRVP